MNRHADDIARGERFEFGASWARFLGLLKEERILQAETSLREMLGVSDLVGKKFLDIGSGTGVFSLAARRLGGNGSLVRLRSAVGGLYSRRMSLRDAPILARPTAPPIAGKIIADPNGIVRTARGRVKRCRDAAMVRR